MLRRPGEGVGQSDKIMLGRSQATVRGKKKTKKSIHWGGIYDRKELPFHKQLGHGAKGFKRDVKCSPGQLMIGERTRRCTIGAGLAAKRGNGGSRLTMPGEETLNYAKQRKAREEDAGATRATQGQRTAQGSPRETVRGGGIPYCPQNRPGSNGGEWQGQGEPTH